MTREEFNFELKACLSSEPNWDGFGSGVPNEKAAELAKQVFVFLESIGESPHSLSLAEDKEGGLLLWWARIGGPHTAQVACMNNGDLVVMTCPTANEVHTWQLKLEIPDQLI